MGDSSDGLTLRQSDSKLKKLNWNTGSDNTNAELASLSSCVPSGTTTQLTTER